MKERTYVVRGPKGRAGQFLVGAETAAGEWGSRKAALRGDLKWAEQAARLHGGTIDAAGWSEIPESQTPMTAGMADYIERNARRHAEDERVRNGWNW